MRLLDGLENPLLYSCRYSGLLLSEEGNVELAICRLEVTGRKLPLADNAIVPLVIGNETTLPDIVGATLVAKM